MRRNNADTWEPFYSYIAFKKVIPEKCGRDLWNAQIAVGSVRTEVVQIWTNNPAPNLKLKLISLI